MHRYIILEINKYPDNANSLMQRELMHKNVIAYILKKFPGRTEYYPQVRLKY
jgi:hypothetical protein